MRTVRVGGSFICTGGHEPCPYGFFYVFVSNFAFCIQFTLTKLLGSIVTPSTVTAVFL